MNRACSSFLKRLSFGGKEKDTQNNYNANPLTKRYKQSIMKTERMRNEVT